MNHAFDSGARWRHLANTIGRSVLGGDAALRRLFDPLLFFYDSV